MPTRQSPSSFHGAWAGNVTGSRYSSARHVAPSAVDDGAYRRGMRIGIIADSKSGVSGAGKEPSSRTHFVSVADNLSAYGVFTHRHLGEIAEQLQLGTHEITFTPHLLPIPRGILSTIYVHLKQPMQAARIESCYRDFYKGRRFVRVFANPKLPEIQFSLNTNYCDLGFCLAPDGQRLVIVSCEDNLIKGAAGQAVQNMNLMFGFPEEEGLL